jgi:hypothetical protein
MRGVRSAYKMVGVNTFAEPCGLFERGKKEGDYPSGLLQRRFESVLALRLGVALVPQWDHQYFLNFESGAFDHSATLPADAAPLTVPEIRRRAS